MRSIVSSTFCRVSSRTFCSLLMTRLTVIADTPASRATSSIVTLPRLRRLGLVGADIETRPNTRERHCNAQTAVYGSAIIRGHEDGDDFYFARYCNACARSVSRELDLCGSGTC